MTELPATIAREARSIHQSLKELLRHKEPFDKEVDFQRKNLRRRYLSLLLVHPYARESKDVETHLWMQTSYVFIASFKQRISNLDRMIQNNNKARQEQPNERQTNIPIVEHRKLVHRFRQFLADEEKFWSQLVVRLRKSFAIDEATPALVALRIISETDSLASNAPEASEMGVNILNGRNHFQFPPEDASLPSKPTTAEEKSLWLSILSKALVCLGDIARYRELYNESGGRPRAGQVEPGMGRRGRSRRGQNEEPVPRPRNYEKAQQCYEQARLLVPDDGNPSHQLAIIATYQKDSFVSLVHYYRALCVQTPYDTASENLGSVLGKALDAWKTRSRRERDRHEALPPRVQVEAFRENIVVLHSLWKVGLEKGLKKMESLTRRHNIVVRDAFISLLSQRYLPTDMISNAVVLSQGALWKHRMIRGSSNKRLEMSPPSEGASAIIEWHILEHLLDLHRGLLEVGFEEVGVPPPRDAPGDDLAQRITATFRRSLPALRIASKWLRANFKYVIQDRESDRDAKRAEGDDDISRNPKYSYSQASTHMRQFWEAYARFVTELARKFDFDKLPALTAPLEEDIEMRGFLPLKGLMGDMNASSESTSSLQGKQAQETHPNVWQLMRIADLIQDANIVAKLEKSPIKMVDRCFYTFKDEITEPQPQPVIPAQPLQPIGRPKPKLTTFVPETSPDKDTDEDNMTIATSRTDDEILREAFHFLNPSGEDDEEQEEDEIVWDPRAPASPVMATSPASPTSHATPMTYTKPLKSPVRHSPTSSKAMSPSKTAGTSISVAPTTAQDLLNDVLSGRTGLSHHESSAPQPALLFGSELLNRSTNIWSAAPDETPLKFNSQPNQTYQTKQHQGASALEMSQNIWSSPYSNMTQSTQNSQPQLIGALSPAAYPHPPIVQSSHQRVPSTTINNAQTFHSQQYASQDQFVYHAPSHQPPIHRPEAFTLRNQPYADAQPPLNATSAMYYQGQPITGYHHSQNPPLHDPRLTHQLFTQPPSQLWGNVG